MNRAPSQSAVASVLMGYTPLIDPRRNAIGVRMPLLPLPGGALPPLGQLYRELSQGVEQGVPPLLIGLDGERIDDSVLCCEPDPHVWVEVPAALACEAAGQALVDELIRAGFPLVLRGRPPVPLAPHLLPGFRLALIDVAEDRRLKTRPGGAPPPGLVRAIPFASGGVTRIDEMEAAFAHDAVACIGWPWDDALEQAGKRAANPDAQTVAELLALVEAGADVADVERVLRRDAALSYRLLRYINNSSFGLRVEITSFAHAVMMLGYAKLKRWLALLLVNASREANLRPVMFASFRRGVFLEKLIGADADARMREEVFILGVFSLLDKLFRRPFAELFETLRVPDNVQETLVSRRGPYLPYLRIAESVERGPSARLAEQIAEAVLSVEQCNRALLETLAAPDLAKAAG